MGEDLPFYYHVYIEVWIHWNASGLSPVFHPLRNFYRRFALGLHISLLNSCRELGR